MPSQGQIIANPVTGDSYEFLETAADTNGTHVRMKATLRRRGPAVPDHLHTLQEETFEVQAGQLTVVMGGEIKVISAGQTITLPKNTPHNHYNGGTEAVVYIHTVKPALDFDYLIENLIGLIADGKSKNGKLGMMQELVSARYLDSKSYLTGIPVGVQQFLAHIVGPVGRILGYRAVYKKYSGKEK